MERKVKNGGIIGKNDLIMGKNKNGGRI